MPQLDFSIYISQFFWMFVSLIILFIYLKFFYLQKINVMLSKRQNMMDANLSENEKMTDEIIRLQNIYHKKITEAKSESYVQISKLKADLDKKYQQTIYELDCYVADEIKSYQKQLLLESEDIVKKLCSEKNNKKQKLSSMIQDTINADII